MAQAEIPKLSIVVPIGHYNSSIHTLNLWVGDLDFTSTELILVHDTNSETCKKELREFVESCSLHQVIIKEVNCHSPGLARNYGLKLARGEFVTFWDADDIPNYKVVISKISAVNADVDVIAGSFVREAFENRELLSTHLLRRDSSPYRLASDPGIWRFVFRRRLIQNLTFEENLIGEDLLFLAEVFALTQEILQVEALFYRYSMGVPGSLTSFKEKSQEMPLVIHKVMNLCKIQEFRNPYTRGILVRLGFSYLKSIIFQRKKLKSISQKDMKVAYYLRILPTFFIMAFFLYRN